MRILRILSILLICCSARALTFSPEDDAAREAAFQWLQVLDSGNYKNAALMMSEEVRGSRDWANYFATRRALRGRITKRQITELKHATTVPGDPQMRQHDIIRFKTFFEHTAPATEEIVMTKMGCCWEVSGYSITAGTSDERQKVES